MGRLEDIIARNRQPRGVRATASMLWRGAVLLLILGLMMFTDWGIPDDPGGASPPAERPAAEPAERRLEGVPVLRSPARPR